MGHGFQGNLGHQHPDGVRRGLKCLTRELFRANPTELLLTFLWVELCQVTTPKFKRGWEMRLGKALGQEVDKQLTYFGTAKNLFVRCKELNRAEWILFSFPTWETGAGHADSLSSIPWWVGTEPGLKLRSP